MLVISNTNKLLLYKFIQPYSPAVAVPKYTTSYSYDGTQARASYVVASSTLEYVDGDLKSTHNIITGT